MKCEYTVRFPPEWVGDHAWTLVEEVMTLRHEKTGEVMHVAGGVLDDGSNLIALHWSRGQNIARMSPDTDWKLEQRLAPPGARPEHVRQTWQGVLDTMLYGKECAEGDELIAAASTDDEKIAAVLHHPKALRIAYENFVKRCSDAGDGPPAFETFELGVSILAGES